MFDEQETQDSLNWRGMPSPVSCMRKAPCEVSFDLPKELLVAKSKRNNWTSSSSMEVMNGLLLAKKEVIHVTQSSADSTRPRRNSESSSRCVSPWECLHAGA